MNKKIDRKVLVKLEDLLEAKPMRIFISIVISIILWYSVYSTYVNENIRIIQDVPITIDTVSLDEQYGLKLYEITAPADATDQKLDITISTPTPVFSKLSSSDFLIAADLSNVTQAGTYPLPLKYSYSDSKHNVTIPSSNTQYIYARFDFEKVVKFDISDVIVNGNITTEEGHSTGIAYSNISSVTVKGPTSSVSRISKAVIETSLNETLSESKTTEGKLVFYDSSNNIVEDSCIETDISGLITVTVPVKRIMELTLDVEFTDVPDGYMASMLEYKITPSVITVKGNKDALSTIEAPDNYIIGTVSFKNLTKSNNTFVFPLNLSTGIESTEDVNSVTLEVDMSGTSYKTFTLEQSETPFGTMNSGELKDVSVLTSKISNVIVYGPTSQLRNLDVNDFTVSADLTGKSSHSNTICTVPAVISIKGHNKCWVVGSYELEVKIP